MCYFISVNIRLKSKEKTNHYFNDIYFAIMKVLFLNPPNIPFTDKSILIEPIDVLSLASYVESLGHVVEVLDFDANKQDISQIQHYSKFNMVIVVYDNHIPLHKDNSLTSLNYIGEFFKAQSVPTVLIGKVGTYNPEILMVINFKLCIRYGHNIEGTLAEILSGKDFAKINNIAYVDNSKLFINECSNQVFNIDDLPITNRALLNSNNYLEIKSMLTSRGCINNCSFCPVKNYHGSWQGKSATKVVAEIENIVKDGVSKIIFLDDNASCDKQRLRDISNLIIKNKINVKLGLLASFNTYDSDTFRLMYKAGFRWVHFGVESASEEVLKQWNKYFDIQQSKNIIKELKQMGYRVRVSIIFDLEPATETNLNKTIDYLLDTQPQEIRLHYLVSRIGSNYNKEYNQNSTQYIHCGDVVITKNKDLKLLENKKNELLTKLSNANYKIIKNTNEWEEIAKTCDKNLKFISFCPSRYGLGW